MTPSFDSLPSTVLEILKKVERLESLISELQLQSKPEAQNHWLSIDELCEYLPGNPAKATIYDKVSKRTIPFHKEAGGKRLAFRKSEIDTWLMSQRRKTITELKEEVSKSISEDK